MKAKQLTEGSSTFLDLIRAISVQLVVIGHGISFCSIAAFLKPPYFPLMQNIAVLIFFILSGYLISNSVFFKLSTDKNYSFKSYFIDRFSRIYSAFIPALFVVIVLDYISKSLSQAYGYSDAFNIKTLVGNIFMLQDFPFLKILGLKITSFGSARPLWTLAIEWWIYLWFGLLTITIFRNPKPKLITILCFIFLSIVPCWNLISGRGNGLTLFWIFGALIGLVYDNYKALQLTRLVKCGILIFFIVMACIRVALTMQEYDAVFAFLLAGCLLIGMELCSEIQINIKPAKIIRLIANYSYTLYLIHYSIYDFILTQFKGSIGPNALFLLGFVISNALALLIGYYSEIKLTKLVKAKLKSKFV